MRYRIAEVQTIQEVLAMIEVDFSNDSKDLMREFGFSEEEVAATVNNRHCALLDHGYTRLIAIQWADDDRIMFIDARITHKTPEPANNRVKIDAVEIGIPLRLLPNLSRGTIEKNMEMEQVMGLISESFGILVRCNDLAPWSTLYAGPCDFEGRQPIIRVFSPVDHNAYILQGSFQPRENRATLVWCFDKNRYREWFEKRFGEK
jgi:hypothetical protein